MGFQKDFAVISIRREDLERLAFSNDGRPKVLPTPESR
jgi:hypothetical protein